MILYDAAQSHPVIFVFFLFFGADTDSGIDRDAATAMLVNQQTYLLQFWFFLLVLEASPAACADKTAPDCNDSDGSKMKIIFFCSSFTSAAFQGQLKGVTLCFALN